MKGLFILFVLICSIIDDAKAQSIDSVKIDIDVNPPELHVWGQVGGRQLIHTVTYTSLNDSNNTQEISIFFRCIVPFATFFDYDTVLNIPVNYPFSILLRTFQDTCDTCACAPSQVQLADSLYIPASQITSFNNELTKAEKEILFYPNPTDGIINLSVTNEIKIISADVYSIAGKKLLNYPQSSKQVNVSSLPPGFYYLHIATNRGMLRRKFIKSQ